MNVWTYQLQANDSGEIFAIYNADPGDFRQGIPEEAHFEAPGLRFEDYNSDDCDLSEAISFDPSLPEEKRTAIMDYLRGKDSPAKLYCCDLSDCHGVRLYFLFSMKKHNHATTFDCTRIYLRGYLSFTITNKEDESYYIVVYRLKDDSESEYSFYVEAFKGDAHPYNLRISRGQTIEVTKFNY